MLPEEVMLVGFANDVTVVIVRMEAVGRDINVQLQWKKLECGWTQSPSS